MFLQRLCEYAERLDMPPPLYSEKLVRYVIELDASGNLLTRRPIDTADPSSRRTQRGQPLIVPDVQRTIAVRPLLLADRAAYTLGLARQGSNPQREARCHEAYLELLQRCAEETGEPAVAAVLRFLQSQPLEQLELPDDFDHSARITFRVGGQRPERLDSVQEFWLQENISDEPDVQPVMECVICGCERPVLRRLKGRIKGIPPHSGAGTAIISANKPAYESYGLQASLISPICLGCAERMTKGLNALLADDGHRFSTGQSVFVFWTRQPTEVSFRNLLTAPQAEEVRALLRSVYGRVRTTVEPNRFYAALLSARKGRAVVRNWIETTAGEAQSNLARWFEAQSIVGEWGEPPQPLGIYSLAAATVRELKDLPPPTLRSLLETALLGQPLPPALLYQVVQRTRAETQVTHRHAVLLKLALSLGKRHLDLEFKEDTMVHLDESNIHPAYLCGRLLAVLEWIQQLAIGKAGTTIIDRFYGTASTAPATVFGTLLQGAQAHLSKVQRDRRGAYVALQRDLEDILSGLQSFPRTLSLDEQALFALGYYHQRAHQRASALERAEAKQTIAEETES